MRIMKRITFLMTTLIAMMMGTHTAQAQIEVELDPADQAVLRQMQMESEIDSIVMEINRSAGLISEMSEKKEAAADTSSQRILLFGDSMLDGIGRRMQDYADHNGHSLYTSIWYGSTVHSWARTTELERLMEKVKPTFVIISLGTNDLGYHDLQARAQSVHEILRVVGDVPYVWIGPAKLPRLNKDFGIVGMLRENVGDNLFYDSYNMQLARFPDNVHPTFAASATWIDRVAEWMTRPGAPHAIRMDKPDHQAKFRNYETHSPRYKGTPKGGQACR